MAPDRRELIVQIARIRAFETQLLELFSQGKLSGTTHTCIGQEACAAALYPSIDPKRDAVFTNHRCHGHFLAHGGSMRALLAEIMGKAGGVSAGRGGSQHLCDGSFFSQGIQGGGMPIAAGYALYAKHRGDRGIVVAHIGDGTLGEGVVYETLNIMSLLKLPMLVVLEHNRVAQSTDTASTTAHDVEARFAAFGLPVDRRPADDPLELSRHLATVVESVRAGQPRVQILDTFRLMAHSKGDDDRERGEIEAAWREDFFAALLDAGDTFAAKAWEAAREEVAAVTATLEAADWEPTGPLEAFAPATAAMATASGDLTPSPDAAARRGAELLNRALDHCLANDPGVLVVGEDLLDPYGGAFKVTKGLSTRYGERIFSTPISEAAIVGFGTGYSLAGGKAVVEIMFGDFAALAADQIINQAPKMHFMYGGQVRVPTTIRLASGGYRGYGPTHSQCLESRFCGVPGLRVVALSRRHDPEKLLTAAVLGDPNPVLFVENKLLYALRPHAAPPRGFRFIPRGARGGQVYPSLAYTTTAEGERPDVTIVTYGGLTDLVEAALELLVLDEELQFDYFVLTQLSPLFTDDIAESVNVSGRLVTVEEGPMSFGVGAEVLAQVAAALPGRALRSARVGAHDVPIPSSRVQESEVLPSPERVVNSVLSLF